jgi:5-hydroxyisourate hydrolase-like protein (transthyretin family)
VVDVSPPTVSIVPNNPFTRGQWVRGAQSVTYQASDNVGVKVARAMATGIARGEHPRPCNYTQRVPCVNGLGAIRVDTAPMPEGSQALSVQAFDAAQNLGTSAPQTVRVDNTPPGAIPVAVGGGQGWRNQNSFDLAWNNPPEADRAPISVAHLRLCPGDGGNCTSTARSGAGIQSLADLAVPGPGEWQARVWREDAAGNQEPENASVPVTLRFDPESPQLAFEPVLASDPTLLSVAVSDKISGLAGGQIELSRENSGIWQALSTERRGSRLVARVDDASLPAGTYQVRATARDQASNQNSTTSLLDGRPMVIKLPLRVPTVMRAGIVTKRTIKRTVRRHGRRRRVRRRITVLTPRADVGFGRQGRVSGLLKNGAGQPIPGAEVRVYSRSATTSEQQLGSVSTNGAGRYTYLVRPGSSQAVRFVYAGTPTTLPVESEITLLVRAGSSMRARPRRVLNGQAVKFSGRLRSLPAPPAGKLVELQVVLSGRWQTFRTTRTGADGRWEVAYRFRRTCGVTRYRFRARLPGEAAYPFETGLTRAVRVQVRGGRCQ